MNRVERTLETLIRRRWVLLGVLLGLTALAAPWAADVGVDNGVDVWFVEDDPALVNYRTFQKTFGNDETVVVGVDLPDGVWTPASLELLRGLSDEIDALPGIRRVLSVASVKTITPRGAQLDVRPLVDGPVEDAEAAAAARARFADDPLLEKGLVSEDGRTTLVVAQMEAMDDIDRRRDDIISAVEGVLARRLGEAGYRYHVSGVGVVYNALNRISQTEGAVFVVLSQLVIFALLFLFFRRLGPVVLALASVGMATVWLLGVFGAAGRSVNMVNMVLPTLVLVIGVADTVHILRHQAAEAGGSLVRTLGFIVRPCLLTSLTTMAGFAALASSRMAVVRDLGIFAAIGVGFAFLSAVGMAAVALPGRFARPRPQTDDRWLESLRRVLERVTTFALRRRVGVLGVAAMAILAGAYGITLIEVDTFSLGFLPENHPTRGATKLLEERMGPFTPLEFTVTAKEAEGLKEPEVLQALERWQRRFEEDPRVLRTLSLADVVGRIHHVMSGEAPAVPGRADQIWQGLEFYESDSDNDRVHLTDGAYRTGRMTAAVPMLSARGFRDLVDEALSEAREELPPEIEVQASGYLPLYVKMMEYVVDSQVTSFALAFLVVFLLVGLFFRSLQVAALSILPNILPVFAMLGLMGWLGINLDVATVTIAAIVIGIAVDDTIHYLFRYRAELRRNEGDHERAALATARGAGGAILGTTVVLAAGFLVLVGAGVKSIAYFGLLSSWAFLVALVGDLVVLPALLAVLKPRL